MDVPGLWPVAAASLLVLGAVRAVTARDPVRQLVGLNVMAAAASLLLVAVAQAGGAADATAARTMAVVGILVAFGVTAFGLRLARRLRASDAGRTRAPDGSRAPAAVAGRPPAGGSCGEAPGKGPAR